VSRASLDVAGYSLDRSFIGFALPLKSCLSFEAQGMSECQKGLEGLLGICLLIQFKSLLSIV